VRVNAKSSLRAEAQRAALSEVERTVDDESE
jgi:hypothetical protein